MKQQNNDFSRVGRRPSGMTVPDHFFDDFKASMEQKIDAYEAQRTAAAMTPTSHVVGHPAVGRLTLRRRFILWTSVAACVGVLIGLALPVSLVPADNAPVTTEEYAEAEVSETQEQLEQDMMLAQLTDYDIFEFYYSEEE